MGSRVAKNPVSIPSGVDVNMVERQLTVKGKLGQLQFDVHQLVNLSVEGEQITFAAVDSSKASSALAGTTRAIVNNMVQGVSQGFTVELTLKGVGYRAAAKGAILDLTLGLSHPVNVEMPEGLTVETPSQTEVVIKGIDKQKVSQMAANIRALRPPEPYKGKGIRYKDEHVALKEGKKK